MKKKQYIAPEIYVCQTYGDAIMYETSVIQGDDWGDAKLHNSFNGMDGDIESEGYNTLWDSRWDSQQDEDDSYGAW